MVGVNIGHAFVVVSLLSEGGPLFVAAQAGYRRSETLPGERLLAEKVARTG
jgi:hypothetical protein